MNLRQAATRTCGCRAFTLIEVLTALVLLAAFSLLAMRFLVSAMSMIKGAQQTHEATVRFDAATAALRADVWNGQRMTLSEGKRLTVVQDRGRTVEWRIDDQGTIHRVEREAGAMPGVSASREWKELGRGVSFEVDSPALVVRSSGAAAPAGEVRMVSQVQVAGGAQ
jgi:prepilin-type N-terminal cleavage/methylation domain-containing protein